ncbi:MAG TPA: TlpA disulfide reductase family protein [Chitinivibrionales bacterium]|nr:TlpA disulfide reductase family protein [Chitinivibrionales bacterium]
MKRIFMIIFAAAVGFSAFAENADEGKLLPAGTAAPSFSLPSLSGDRVSLSTYSGETLSKPYLNKIRHTVILSFWATYCKPCQKEIPELQAFIEKHKKDNVLVLCISIDKEGSAVVEPFVKEKNYTVQVLLDPYTKTSERYGVKSLPALFVIDTMGVIRFSSRGYDEKNPLGPKLEKILKAVREGGKIAVSADEGGATVPVKAVEAGKGQEAKAGEGEAAKAQRLTPKQRWNAIARVECGEPIEKVAAAIRVSPDELRAWYNDLKKAAVSLWSADTAAR